MNGITVELIEAQDAICFISGITLADIRSGDRLTKLIETGKNQKSQTQRAVVALVIASVIVDGEPVEHAAAGQSVMLGLTGDASALVEAAGALRWKRKSGRLLRTSQQGLLLTT